MLYLGADHGGFELKEQLKQYLSDENIEYEDLGNLEHDSGDDYPVFARAVAKAVAKDPMNHKGIVLCRTGVGVSMVANKYDNIRSALGFDDEQVKKARGDEAVNVLAIPSDYTNLEILKKRVKIFLDTPFSGEERHERRLHEIEAIEDENFKHPTKQGCSRNCACK